MHAESDRRIGHAEGSKGLAAAARFLLLYATAGAAPSEAVAAGGAGAGAASNAH